MADFSTASLADFSPGSQFLRYRLIEQIGIGGQAFVWSALDQPAGRLVAIKFNKTDSPDQKMESEAQFTHQAGQLMQLTHPHILPLYDFGSTAPYRYLVSPFLSGGSLLERILEKTLTISQTLDYALRVASVLDYLHGKGVIHRDVKPSNNLLDAGGNLFVADFGLARNILETTQAMHTGHGTPPYAPPEQHSLRLLTKKSDIFSFGVMLYEMLTGELPWGGTKALGLQQLFTNEEIPNPAIANPNVPQQVWQVVRKMTATDPEERYETAMVAMERFFAAFGRGIPRDASDPSGGYDAGYDADRLLERSARGWSPGSGSSRLSLSQFALLDLENRKPRAETATGVSAFMLEHALLFGYEDSYWWGRVANPDERLQISLALLRRKNLSVGERLARHLAEDPQIQSLQEPLSDEDASLLLETARNSGNPRTAQQVFNFLKGAAQHSPGWRKTALGPASDQKLAELALGSQPSAQEAAVVIGTLRSEAAVQVLEASSGSRRETALRIVQQTAGSLPGSLPAAARLRIYLGWVLSRLSEQPLRLLQAYGFIALGASLSAGIQVFLTYRLPTFMDSLRILGSVERGAIFGLLTGAGILAARVIVERFPEWGKLARVLLGTLIGSAILTVAVYVYDILLNDLVPSGILIPAGCFLIAAGFSISGLASRRWVKMLICYPFIFLAAWGIWLTHVALTRAVIGMTPIFMYEYSWSGSQVLLACILVSIPLATLANLGDLHPRAER